MTKIYKSYLWTSALLPEKYSYAQKVGADICIIDLEDSVADKQKDNARNIASIFLKKDHGYRYGVRINSIRTPDGIRDITALLDNKSQPCMVVLPKVESPEEIIMANQWLSLEIPNVCFCATIETPKGMQNIYNIAAASNNLKYLVWGSADLSAEMGVSYDWPGADQIRTQLVIAASTAGIHAFDTAEFDLFNDAKLKKECERIKSLGMIGKACIHPNQVSIVNNYFSPLSTEIDEANKILNDHTEKKRSITVSNGRIAGPPMRKMAKRTLSLATNLG